MRKVQRDIEVHKTLLYIPFQSSRVGQPFHNTHNFHTFHDLAKDGVLAIQLGHSRVGDEKLAAVCIGPGIGHREDARAIVAQSLINFIIKTVSRPAKARAGGIAGLGHEIGQDTMKEHPIVETFLGQKDKVIDRLRRFIGKEFNTKAPLAGLKHRKIGLRWIYNHGRRLGILKAIVVKEPDQAIENIFLHRAVVVLAVEKVGRCAGHTHSHGLVVALLHQIAISAFLQIARELLCIQA